MCKDAFLEELRTRLAGLPDADVQNSLDYYAEMIDERTEDGMREEEAVSAVGDVEEIAARIIADVPLPRMVRARVGRRRTLRTWEIVMLVLGAPLWLPLLLCVFTVMMAAYIVLWACVLVLFETDLALAIGVPTAVFGGIVCLRLGNTAPAGVYLGSALICAGLAVFLFFGSTLVAKGVLRVGKAALLWIKRQFMRKEAA